MAHLVLFSRQSSWARMVVKKRMRSGLPAYLGVTNLETNVWSEEGVTGLEPTKSERH